MDAERMVASNYEGPGYRLLKLVPDSTGKTIAFVVCASLLFWLALLVVVSVLLAAVGDISGIDEIQRKITSYSYRQKVVFSVSVLALLVGILTLLVAGLVYLQQKQDLFRQTTYLERAAQSIEGREYQDVLTRLTRLAEDDEISQALAIFRTSLLPGFWVKRSISYDLAETLRKIDETLIVGPSDHIISEHAVRVAEFLDNNTPSTTDSVECRNALQTDVDEIFLDQAAKWASQGRDNARQLATTILERYLTTRAYFDQENVARLAQRERVDYFPLNILLVRRAGRQWEPLFEGYYFAESVEQRTGRMNKPEVFRTFTIYRVGQQIVNRFWYTGVKKLLRSDEGTGVSDQIEWLRQFYRRV